MTETKTADDRRVQHRALLGLLLQTAAFLLLLVLGLWQGRSHLLLALAHVLAIGIPLWLILYLILNQMRRVGIEALETDELRRAQGTGANQGIFEHDDEALLLEQNRLKWMVRTFLPAGTILGALTVVVGHLLLWGWSLDSALNDDAFVPTADPSLTMWFVIGVGFLCFLYARYALALARLPQWGLIRGGAVCMAGSALASFVVAVTLMVTTAFDWAEPIAAYLLPLALLILAAEFVVNFIFDLYRPRTPGEIPRPSFDSRLLGLISEPGGLAKSLAEAANYQFGFQVSSTWFYKLLQRWLFPIVVVSIVAVLLLTSVVIVDAGEEVVVEYFGHPSVEADDVLSPGLHYKWPYPIEIVYRVPTGRISEVIIGEARDEDGDGHAHEDEAILWTEKHDTVAELMLLVASPKLEMLASQAAPGARSQPSIGRSDGTESVAVSLLMVSLPIEYRVRDITKFLYNYVEPEKLLEEVAYRFMSDYGASVDIDELMGPGRTKFNQDVKRAVQDELDRLEVGIELVFAGLRDAHPPADSKVAEAFQSVVAAETRMSALIETAQGEARRILIKVAGTETRAKELDEAILSRDRLSPGTPEFAAAEGRVEELLTGDVLKGIAPASGESAVQIAEARASASDQVSLAAAKAMAFGTQVAAYKAAPNLYRQRKILEGYAELQDTRKYLITGDRSNVTIIHDTGREAGLDEVLREDGE